MKSDRIGCKDREASRNPQVCNVVSARVQDLIEIVELPMFLPYRIPCRDDLALLTGLPAATEVGNLNRLVIVRHLVVSFDLWINRFHNSSSNTFLYFLMLLMYHFGFSLRTGPIGE